MAGEVAGEFAGLELAVLIEIDMIAAVHGVREEGRRAGAAGYAMDGLIANENDGAESAAGIERR